MDPGSNKIAQNRADLLARLFNVTMNSALLYNGSHPTTLKNILSLHKDLSEILSQCETVSLIINRDNLFVEEWPVAEAINTRRLVQQFIRTGIFSVTFCNGLSLQQLQIFINAASDMGNDVSAESITSLLLNEMITTIRINYVRFGKILSGQKNDCSEHDNADRPVKISSIDSPNKREINKILTAAIEESDSSENALRLVSNLKSEIQSAQPLALNSMLDILNEIRMGLAEAVEIGKINGKRISTVDNLSSQLDELTRQTVLKLIKEEYDGGAVSVKRLAQIICRLLPDINEIRKLLPDIKKLLTEEGMSLADYLQLIKLLNVEIDSESLADSLSGAAEKVGVTVTDIIDAFRKEPDDAARLILLASEIRQGAQADDLQLSNFLTEYIEKTSKALALQSGKIDRQGTKTIRMILSQLEEQLMQKLHNCGVQTEVLQAVKRTLSENFESAFDSVTMEWILSVCTGKNPDELESIISGMIEHQSQLARIQDTLSESLLSNGFKSENIQKIISQLACKDNGENKVLTLPSAALSSNNMLFLLNREINQHKRYGTPFSTMLYTVEKAGDPKDLKSLTEEDKKNLIPQLFQFIKKYLRETDLLGTTGVPQIYSLFSIMTMTGFEGAKIVRDRIIKGLEKKKFNLNKNQVSIEVTISITVPEKQNIKDLRTYLNAVKLNHQTGSGPGLPDVKKEHQSKVTKP